MRGLIITLIGVAALGIGALSPAMAAPPLAAPPLSAPLSVPPPMPAASESRNESPLASKTPAAAAIKPPRPAPAAAEAQQRPADAAAASARGELGELPGAEQLPPAHPIAPDTRIEQIRQGNRVAEIRVTPAGSSRSYVIVTREPSRQLSLQDSGTGLSTPRFLHFDF